MLGKGRLILEVVGSSYMLIFGLLKCSFSSMKSNKWFQQE